MKAEYTRMRDIAQKRIKRMSQSEWTWTKTYKEHKNGFQKLKDIDPRDFAKAYSELSKFVTAKSSSVTGQSAIRSRTMKTLNENIGRKAVTKQNYQRVISILNESRLKKIVYDSETVAELAEMSLVLSDDQFDDILDNLASVLENADEFMGNLDEYMSERKIEEYQKVDMDDFLKEVGWKSPEE